jgi:phage repressor protein C with HTH and peptisase S24 domain
MLWLTQGKGTMLVGFGKTDLVSNAEPAGRPRAIHPVKIKGLAMLGENGYYDEIESDGDVDSYSTDASAYGLRVKGDSMHPAIRNGSVVIIEPNGMLVPGEYVAIALSDGKKMVKELVFQRTDEIVVESVNGNKRMTISRNDIVTMHPVAAVVSPSKWRPE